MIAVPKGDKGYNLAFTVTDNLGVVKNINAYTIKLKMWVPGVPGTKIIDGACVIDVGASGTCHYVIGATDMVTAGRYQAELELTATGIIESTETFTIVIKESA
jgi:hypothetical protein